jgi:hypothetical protein
MGTATLKVTRKTESTFRMPKEVQPSRVNESKAQASSKVPDSDQDSEMAAYIRGLAKAETASAEILALRGARAALSAWTSVTYSGMDGRTMRAKMIREACATAKENGESAAQLLERMEAMAKEAEAGARWDQEELDRLSEVEDGIEEALDELGCKLGIGEDWLGYVSCSLQEIKSVCEDYSDSVLKEPDAVWLKSFMSTVAQHAPADRSIYRLLDIISHLKSRIEEQRQK